MSSVTSTSMTACACGALHAWTMLFAMARRICVSGTSSSPASDGVGAGRAGVACWADAAAGTTRCAACCWLCRCAMKSSTSLRDTRPPSPVPSICEMSIPFSPASLRTAGVARTSERSGPAAGTRVSRGFAAAAGGSAGAAACGCGGADGAVAAASPSAVSKIARRVPIGTVWPSWTFTSLSVPATGEGISVFTLSVCTSTRRSYLLTFSPGCFSHFPIVPSVTDSPSLGILSS